MTRPLLSIIGVWLWLGTLLLVSCGPAPAPTAVAALPIDTPTTPPAATLGSAGTGVAATPTAATATATEAVAPPSNTPEPTAATAQPSETPEVTLTAEAPASSPAPVQPSPATTTGPPEPVATGTARPLVRFFRVTPTITANLGDALTLTWEASGQKAELCPISGPGPVESRCHDVPLTGSTGFVTDEEAMTYTGIGLRVTAGDTSTWSLVNVNLQCQNLRPWFFADPPLRCPADLVHESYAAGQYFERGLTIWTEDPDTFYLFYRGQDEGGFQVFDWMPDIRLKPGASPDHRVAEEPPAGLHEPVSGFGMAWRGEVEGVRADVRQRLGWATEPEFGFDTAYQCETVFYPGLWDCFLRGPRGEILSLRPDSTAQVRWLWQEWPPSP